MSQLSPTRLGVDLGDTLRALRERASHGSPDAVPTGFAALDLALGGGIRQGELTVVAGRPGVGVTLFVLGLLRSAALRHGLPVLGIASGQNLGDRHLQLVSAEARLPLNHLRYGPMNDDDWSRIARVSERLEAAPIWLDTTTEVAVGDVADAVEEVRAENSPALVLIDGLEGLRSEETADSRPPAVPRAVERLRALARRRDLAMVVTCHLHRSPRADHYRSLAEMRSAGDLDAIADTILLLHRDDVYDPKSQRPGEADVIVAK